MSREVFDMLGPDGFGAYQVDWSEGPSFTKVSRPPRGLLIPGFVDIHIHGAFGIDFMSAKPGEMELLCNRLCAEGYEGFLPTTISASPDAIVSALENLPIHPAILGFHLEGPFISPVYPGAQPKDAIQEPPVGDEAWTPILRDPRLKIVTLAPEIPRALELITKLMLRDVIVSMGHSNATFEETRRGFEFGATHVTHAFNAMRPFHHREAGFVGYVLDNRDLVAELIYDRHHVCKEAAEILLKSKSASNVIAVSDGTMASGMPPGTALDMWGLKAIVGRGDVRLEDGTLAGSAITLADAFKNLYEDFGPETAIELCCLGPRRALKMAGPPKVWVELDKNLEIVSIRTRDD